MALAPSSSTRASCRAAGAADPLPTTYHRTNMTNTPQERHALAARLDREWSEADPRAYREACLSQALLEAYKVMI